MTVIVDYGVGNLFSIKSSLAYIGEEAVVSGERKVISAAKRLILPGVGAFGDAAKKLCSGGLDSLITERASAGVPLLGICLGMQLLLEKSYEYGEHSGLGLIKGSVRPIADVIPSGYKIPHIGWNALELVGHHPVFRYANCGDMVYFVHSYYGAECDDVIATAEYGAPLTAAVAHGNVCGCQFHPEKSGRVGLGILKAFCEWSGA